MLRIIIQQVAIFLLPVVAYAVYMLYLRRLARRKGEVPPPWESGAWFWVVVAGLVLTIAVFLGIAAFEEPSDAFRTLPPRPGP